MALDGLADRADDRLPPRGVTGGVLRQDAFHLTGRVRGGGLRIGGEFQCTGPSGGAAQDRPQIDPAAGLLGVVGEVRVPMSSRTPVRSLSSRSSEATWKGSRASSKASARISEGAARSARTGRSSARRERFEGVVIRTARRGHRRLVLRAHAQDLRELPDDVGRRGPGEPQNRPYAHSCPRQVPLCRNRRRTSPSRADLPVPGGPLTTSTGGASESAHQSAIAARSVVRPVKFGTTSRNPVPSRGGRSLRAPRLRAHRIGSRSAPR